ncbi:hypothetical protein AVEN_81023-1 [Araneus ventricosus]|uniref:Reverse transcriptase domain-containing protein n=1 Tax=Araneus ventricosus TaxID=182803 RepID=A0A4Y2FX96_ARAVE|nr:hypothetical protein AVEN_251793-1 [Araneus ventricosus]GBM45617.1 hypothetical protein AVEN_51926-1 [Araneus ventricosus]GBM45622.1 hypothetical protein AVEN_62272-1 [Araneus ventricosus]GBM45647.1 hypothetical protein AVEN_81023-1 [Araneus ventricosus]
MRVRLWGSCGFDPKLDGKTRFCIDYRKLNEITVPDSYPLPRMDDLLQSAKHTTFMSTIDLKSGYHQIIHCFENDDKDVNHVSWLERGYLMN